VAVIVDQEDDKLQLELFDFDESKLKTIDISQVEETFPDSVFAPSLSDSKIQRAIDNLSLSADQKAMISQISQFTLSIGKKVFSFGRKILELSLLFFKKYPATSFGLVVGLVVSSLIPGGTIKGFAVPIISSLTALLKKLVILFAVGLGLKEDLKNSALGTMISDATLNIRKSMEA